MTVLVDSDVAPFVDLHAGPFEPEVLRIGDRANGEEHVAPAGDPAIVAMHRHSLTVMFHADRPGALEKMDAAPQQLVFERGRHFCVLVR